MPYLLNAWYAAAMGSEVSAKPFRRTILEQPVALFRDADGDARAVFDRCPHRFVPLSRGRVVDGALECGYHGLRFDGTGACVSNPHGDGSIPKNASVRSFPLYERYGYVWIWPGDASLADPALLPAFEFLEQPHQFAANQGYLYARANYQLVVDNLLDLSHVSYVHKNFVVEGVTAEERLRATEVELIRVGNSIINRRYRRNFPPNRTPRVLFGVSDRVDSRTTMHWHAPSLLYFDLGVAEMGQAEEDGLCTPAAHFVTPETETTSHYFFVQARNRRLDEEEVGQAFFDLTYDAFVNEDEPMVAAQQVELGELTDLLALRPAYLPTDQAAVAARRLLSQLIAAERVINEEREQPAA